MTDNLFHTTTPDGIEVDINASDIVSGELTSVGTIIDDFAKTLKNSAASGAFGIVGLAAGAVVSAIENNAQGLHVTDNVQKTLLDSIAGYYGAKIGATIGELLGPLAPPLGPIVFPPTGAVIGAITGGIFSNNIYPGIQAQLLASNKASAVQA